MRIPMLQETRVDGGCSQSTQQRTSTALFRRARERKRRRTNALGGLPFCTKTAGEQKSNATNKSFLSEVAENNKDNEEEERAEAGR